MKKIVLTAVALLSLSFGLRLSAGPVSADRALGLANHMMPAVSTRAAEPLKVLWDGEVAAGVEAPALYVIGRESGGFVIIAGDDRVYPVLAISDREVFRVEGMPANVRWWMERMKAYVRSVAVPEAGAVAAWSARTRADASLPAAEVTNKFERLTPKWDQGNSDMYHFGRYVFNAKCPGNGAVPTGCVAAALGEVLTYESGLAGIVMPAAAHGTITEQEYLKSFPGGYAPVLPYELGTTYLWEGLRTLTDVAAINDAISAGQNDLIDNLGQLLADLGAMVHAGYGYDGTSADLGNTLPYLMDHLDINKRACSESESAYTPRQWVGKLKAELDLRPVLYSGQDPSRGGHQYVLDGYGSYGDETVFHVNFGWAGSCNGYYRLGRVDSGSNGDYSYDCDAIFGFYPDANSTFENRLSYSTVTFTDGTEGHGLAFNQSFQLNTWLYLRLYCIKNDGGCDYTGGLRVAQEDKNGNQVGNLLYEWSDYSLSHGYMGYPQIPVRFSSASFGDRVVVYYASSTPGEWLKVGYVEDGTLVGELPLMPAPFIKTEASYSAGDYFAFRLKNNSEPYAGTVWTVTAPDGTKTTYNQSEREFQLTQAGKYKIDAAIAETVGGTVTEHVVTVINVQ